MTRLAHLLRAVCALALAFPLVLATGSPATARPMTPFHAAYAEGCFWAYARGDLDWNPRSAGLPQVELTGVLVHDDSRCDRPILGTTFAMFTAYAGGTAVEQEAVIVYPADRDRLTQPFQLRLTAAEWHDPVDRVDVEVCHSTYSALHSVATVLSCGRVQTLLRSKAAT